MLLLTVILVFALSNNDANITVMNFLTKHYNSKSKSSALVTVPGKIGVTETAEFIEHMINRRHLKLIIVTTESAKNMQNRSAKVTKNNLKAFYLKKFLKYFAPEYDLVTVNPHLKTSTAYLNATNIFGKNIILVTAEKITTQRQFHDSSSEFFPTSFESSPYLTLNKKSKNNNFTTNVAATKFSLFSKTPSTNASYLRRVQKVMKSLWTPYPMRTRNITNNHHFRTMTENVTKESKLNKIKYSSTIALDNSTLKSDKKMTSRMNEIPSHTTLKTTALLSSNTSVVVPSASGETLDIGSSTLNSTATDNMSMYTTLRNKFKEPDVTMLSIFNLSTPSTTEKDSVFRKLLPFLFNDKSTTLKNSIVSTNCPVFLTHNTSLICNQSSPTLMIMNDTHVSILSNEGDISAETLTKAKNGTWYSRAGTVFTGWMGDVSKIWHCFTDPYEEPAVEDVRFFLYTRRNMQIPEELFVNITEDEYTTQIEYELPPVFEQEFTSTSSVVRRQVNNKEGVVDDEEEDLEEPFEKLNPSKCVIHSKFFNVLLRTKIIIHGYTQTYEDELLVNIRQAYLHQASYNVIMVDWSTLAESPCYRTATKHTQGVARILSKFLDQLAEGGIEMDRIHIIGFSLGAQVAGLAGDSIHYGSISRITGLDPALPYYHNIGPEGCLDASDASFVDVIHTSAGFLGQSAAQGHADFYPNGGSQQPGCDFSALACSHRRAALYFAESINSSICYTATQCTSWDDFTAGKCNSTSQHTVYMGDPCTTNATGLYYLVTGESEPFGEVEEQEELNE